MNANSIREKSVCCSKHFQRKEVLPRCHRLLHVNPPSTKLFRIDLYADLVQAISSEIQTLLPKAWSKKIIGKQHLDSSLELSTTAHQKATAFMSAVASRIKLDSNAFDVFLSLLKEIESLEYMKERLEQEMAKLDRDGHAVNFESTFG